MTGRALIAGVGMTPFTKPGRSESYDVMGAEAARAAMADAGIDYADVGQAYAGYVFGDTGAGQRVLYHLGLSGVPIINVNNACATGSTALYLARQAVEAGVADVALAVGFEQMAPGALGSVFPDRVSPLQQHLELMVSAQGFDKAAPPVAQFFGGAALAHQRRYGTRDETFARVAVKARRHAATNPFAVFREPLTIEEVLASAKVFGPLTRLQCCAPTCGAAAAVVVSPAFARRHGATRLVEIAGQALTTDKAEAFTDGDLMKLIGYDMTRDAASRAFEQAGVGADDIEVVELHDCFTANELITYEALGLCGEGEAERFISDGENTYGGKVVTNPSGGLLSKGHPLGATGLAQCAELVWQVRGEAGSRQVENVRHALQHNLGLGGACVATVYRRAA
jgi:acetyl-CoA acetyltransferase